VGQREEHDESLSIDVGYASLWTAERCQILGAVLRRVVIFLLSTYDFMNLFLRVRLSYDYEARTFMVTSSL